MDRSPEADGADRVAAVLAERSEFAGRRRTKSIDGVCTHGWFTEELTPAACPGAPAAAAL